MAYTAPSYDAVNFTADSAAYTAPLFDAVVFTAVPETPTKLIYGDGVLRGIVGYGSGAARKTLNVVGVGKLRKVRCSGHGAPKLKVVGSGVLAISAIGRDTECSIVGSATIVVRAIGVAGDHVC